jgi:hypothetical protein
VRSGLGVEGYHGHDKSAPVAPPFLLRFCRWLF